MRLLAPLIGIALLASSWLLGLPYYHGARPAAWAVVVLLGTACFLPAASREASKREGILVAALLVPPAAILSWPQMSGPLWLLAGFALAAAGPRRRWLKRLSGALRSAGVVMLAQSAAVVGYEWFTAHSHDLPWPVAGLVAAVGRLFGVEVAAGGGALHIATMRQNLPLAASWGLAVDLVSVCLLAGGAAWALAGLLGLRPGAARGRAAYLRWAAAAAAVLAWLPVRAAVLLAIMRYMVLRTRYDEPMAIYEWLWSPWVHALALVPAVALVLIIAPRAQSGSDGPRAPARGGATAPRWTLPAAAGLWAIGAWALLFGAYADPIGARKEGRVLVDEHHSQWERTDRPFDNQWYGHESTYTYYCIYDYLSRFYRMGRLEREIDDEALGACDVLVLKIPTSRYTSPEVLAIERFVERGGGLLLIGEHTNFRGSGVHLNDVARRFGFRFEYDYCYGIDELFSQHYVKPLSAHPVLAYLSEVTLAGSCSIRPRIGSGRAVMRATGLKNHPPDYHASNFIGATDDRAEMRSGAFIQMWATRHGAGRVVAFTDSTIFSNFSTFEPGKSELMMGMVEWLNRTGGGWGGTVSFVLGALLLAGGAFLGRRLAERTVLLASLLAGGSVGIGHASRANESMPYPPRARPFVRVNVDRTVSRVPLSKSGFIGGKRDGFGIFEQWILRLGYFTSRREGEEVFDGRAALVLYPSAAPGRSYLERMEAFVADGGVLVVVDAPENEESTADELLAPFGLRLDERVLPGGTLEVPAGWRTVPVKSARPVGGGEPWIRLDGQPVCVRHAHGKGRVVVVGFGERFTDLRMGVTAHTVPSQDLKDVFELQFAILRGAIEGVP
jgi:hypothetical protein